MRNQWRHSRTHIQMPPTQEKLHSEVQTWGHILQQQCHTSSSCKRIEASDEYQTELTESGNSIEMLRVGPTELKGCTLTHPPSSPYSLFTSFFQNPHKNPLRISGKTNLSLIPSSQWWPLSRGCVEGRKEDREGAECREMEQYCGDAVHKTRFYIKL